MIKKYDYAIVGAGIFGATFARIMTNAGYNCIVIDSRNHIAGNCYSENVDGIEVHKYGAHIFHTSNEDVWKFVNRFTKFDTFINSPIARYNDECYNLPFNMNTFTKIWPHLFSEKDIKQQIQQEIDGANITEITNLEEQAISLVGTTIYKKLVKGYTEKQWGKKCTELPPSLIKRLPLRFTFDNNYFNDKYQGIPTDGYTKMIERMLEGIPTMLNTHVDESMFNELANKIVYCGRIDTLLKLEYGPLEYRSLEFETMKLDVQNFQGNAVVNYTDNKTEYTRIIEHKWFKPNRKVDGTIISYEYPSKMTLSSEPFYPVNNEKNNELYEKYVTLLKSLHSNVLLGGRLGLYKYLDMDDAILEAMKLAENELKNGSKQI